MDLPLIQGQEVAGMVSDGGRPMANTFVPGVSLLLAPGPIEALEMDYKTPSSYNWSVGLRRELGWGTSMDATYVGSAGRNLPPSFRMARNDS